MRTKVLGLVGLVVLGGGCGGVEAGSDPGPLADVGALEVAKAGGIDFDPGSGVLTITGSAGDDVIEVGQDAGLVRVNGHKVKVAKEELALAAVTRISMAGLAGDDRLVVDEEGGLLPPVTVEGGDGDDTVKLVGSSAAEELGLAASGARLAITLAGAGVVIDGGGLERAVLAPQEGADAITLGDISGTGVAVVKLDVSARAGKGDDDGAADVITLQGTQLADQVTIGPKRVTGLPVDVRLAGATAQDRLFLDVLDGDDTVDGSAAPLGLVLAGGYGNDLLVGSEASDVLTGGRGVDGVVANGGDDLVVWNPGDQPETIDGGAGLDTLSFRGANVGERFDFTSSGGHLLLDRDIASIRVDMMQVEKVDLATLGGADVVTVHDVEGTGPVDIAVDLSGYDRATDGAADVVGVEGTEGDDLLLASDEGGVPSAAFGEATVTVHAFEPQDLLRLAGLGGDDTLDARATSGVMQLRLEGGEGSDTVLGGSGDDVVSAGRGLDAIDLGAGDDTLVWNPGDASDVLDGGAGADTLRFEGANIAERIELTAAGDRVALTRDIAAVALDLGGFENVLVDARGGADSLEVHDLAGTGVSLVTADLESQPGSGAGDAAGDVVVVDATDGDDALAVVGDASAATVSGLAATVQLMGSETFDRLQILGGDGDDVVDASGLSWAPALVADGGAGADVLLGGAGDDALFGGDGDDVLLGGPGQDQLDGGAGDNIVIAD